ncbi:MAG TPA: ABC transporter ATP-binding protein [Streptosporangiaceae bacterium]|nr:ABC transporter ATP-binding protein [Streptosporangiaceae bacterium]
MIAVDGLTKRYGRAVVVDGISFEVGRGEIFGILGRNGAGKTTTVECLQGLRRSDGGWMRVLGLDPQTQAGELRQRIGSQLQESALPQRIKVWEALRWFASFVPGARDPGQLIEQWGLAEKRNTHFSELSGGQRQRLFIALALVNDPELVFLDEMTTGLDPAARHTAWNLVRAVRDGGTSVVLVTHFMEEAERLCDRVAVLERGKIVALDTPGALIASHARQITVRFSANAGDLGWLAGVTGVDQLAQRNGSVEIRGTGAVLAEVGAALVGHGIHPPDLRADRPNLEDVFLSITGRRSDE